LPNKVEVTFMFMLLTLLTVCSPFAFAEPFLFTRPKFGIEVTFSNDVLQEMQTNKQYEDFSGVANLDETQSLKVQLDKFYALFPKQIQLYSQVIVDASIEVFPEVQGSAFLHKGLPSSLFIYAPDEFISLQFEWQAIEMQSHEGTIPTYFQRRAQLDKVYKFMRARNLVPDREYGAGHIHMGVGDGPPLHPEVMRNFIVRMFNFDSFWPLVAIDIESGPIQESERNELALYLTKFDQLLERYKKIESFQDGKELSEVLFEGLTINVNLLQTQFVNNVNAYAHRGEFVQMKIYLGQMLSRVIRYKMVEVLGGNHAFVYSSRTKTFEFRRIPSQENVDEMILWMSVLEGHWRAAHEQTDLVQLIENPKPLSSGYAEIELFNSFILGGEQSPESFRHFLPRHLKQVRTAYRLPGFCESKL